MKAHDLARHLLAGVNLPVVAETRDGDVFEVTGSDVDARRFFDENGRVGYPVPAECVFLLTSDT